MQILETVESVRDWTKAQKASGRSVHLVPTMGFFHEGHLSLMRQAKSENAAVIVSLFVNPRQFNPNEDLSRYPRDFERDRAMAESVGVEAIFAPNVEEMYPEGYQTSVIVSELSKGLCGAYRPGHFEGVATVVLKLFNAVMPDKAFFGLKDYQQFRVIERMVRDLNVPVEVMPCELIREPDGLAMSSRNVYLSPQEREQAIQIYQALLAARRAYESGERDASALTQQTREKLEALPLARVQYVELADAESLQPLPLLEKRAVMAVAVYIGQTRLIDNVLLG